MLLFLRYFIHEIMPRKSTLLSFKMYIHKLCFKIYIHKLSFKVDIFINKSIMISNIGNILMSFEV